MLLVAGALAKAIAQAVLKDLLSGCNFLSMDLLFGLCSIMFVKASQKKGRLN